MPARMLSDCPDIRHAIPQNINTLRYNSPYHFPPEKQMAFNWHSETLTRATPVDKHYKNTQNVRRFMLEQCGAHFTFDRDFMAWIRNDQPKNLGDVADEWTRRQVP